MEATSLRFAAAARAIGAALHRRGLVVPAFRSPPRLAGADRTLRRRGDGGATVAIRLRGRPWPAVLADMVEGSVVVNQLEGPPADACRSVLWSALDAAALLPPPPPPPPVGTAPGVAGAARPRVLPPTGSSRPDGALAERSTRRPGRTRPAAARTGTDRARPSGQSPPAAA